MAPAAHHQIVPHWAIRFGIPGLFLVSAIDASIVPLAVPGSTDLLLLWLVSHNGNPWLLASSAVAGSLVGGYLTWALGKKSGEAALESRIGKLEDQDAAGVMRRAAACMRGITSIWG